MKIVTHYSSAVRVDGNCLPRPGQIILTPPADPALMIGAEEALSPPPPPPTAPPAPPL